MSVMREREREQAREAGRKNGIAVREVEARKRNDPDIWLCDRHSRTQ